MEDLYDEEKIGFFTKEKLARREKKGEEVVCTNDAKRLGWWCERVQESAL